MELDAYITESLNSIKAAGLRPKKVHFDLHAHNIRDTGEVIVLSGTVTADGNPVKAPEPEKNNLSGGRISFSIPVIDWDA